MGGEARRYLQSSMRYVCVCVCMCARGGHFVSWHTSFLIAPLLSAARREGKHPDGVVTLSGSTAPQVNSQRCSINISVASAAEPERPVKLCYVYV